MLLHLVLCLLASTSCLAVSESEVLGDRQFEETVKRLLEEAESHHSALKRSVEQLDHYLTTAGISTLVTAQRQRRDSLQDRLSDSLATFCQTFLNHGQASPPSLSTSSPSPSSPSLSTTQSPTHVPTEPGIEVINGTIWHTPIPPIEPLSVRVIEKPNNVSVVEFKVRHSEVGSVETLLYLYGHWVFVRKELRVRKSSKLPKKSTVRFRIKSDWCGAKYRDVAFSFKSSAPNVPHYRLEVRVCRDFERTNSLKLNDSSTDDSITNDSSTNDSESQNDASVLPPRPRLRYYLTNEELVVRKGENISMIAELDIETSAHDDNMGMSIYIRTTAYNEQLGVSSALLYDWNVRRHSEKGVYPLRRGTSEIKDPIPFTLTSAEISVSRKPSSDVTSLEGDTPKMLLIINFDTDSGDDTALVEVMQRQSYVSETLAGVSLSFKLLISRNKDEKKVVFPDGLVSFVRTPSSQLCDTNTHSPYYEEDDGWCRLVCSAFGKSISSLTIAKKDGKLNQKSDAFYPNWHAFAYLRVDGKDPDSNGIYICRARTESGEEFEYSIDFKAGRYPVINESESGFAYDKTGNAILNCVATGDDVDISLWREEQGEDVRLDNDPDYGLRVERGENRAVYTLEFPSGTEDLRVNWQRFYCNATNSLSHDTADFWTP